MTAKPTGTQPTVNAALVHRQFAFLPGEICLACGAIDASHERPGRAVPETNQAQGWEAVPVQLRAKRQPNLQSWDSAQRGNTLRDRAGVSRGHSRSEGTEGPNIATTWRSRANLGVPTNPTG
jgi:hypothetical protein